MVRPSLIDFTDPKVCYTGIILWMYDAGEDFFDYNEFIAPLEDFADFLVEKGEITKEMRKEVMRQEPLSLVTLLEWDTFFPWDLINSDADVDGAMTRIVNKLYVLFAEFMAINPYRRYILYCGLHSHSGWLCVFDEGQEKKLEWEEEDRDSVYKDYLEFKEISILNEVNKIVVPPCQ